MAMRTASPWWTSIVFAFGLLLTFLGERLFGHSPGLRSLLTGAGVVLLVGLTAVRAYTTVSTTGARRRVERTLLLCQGGVLLALVLYSLTTKWGLRHVDLSEKGEAKFTTVMTVLWMIAMLGSLIPMYMIEASLGIALRTAFDLKGKGADEGVEYYRVREIGWSGLSIALATSFLFVTCSVADQRNISKDVSYFKTSSPGQSTKNIVKASSQPIKVFLFFPDPNEVKEQVRGYFEDVASATNKLTVESLGRLQNPELAEKFQVGKDGSIVIVYGSEKDEKPKFQKIDVDTDIQKARESSTNKLRNLDNEVNKALMKLVRDKRKAYIMVGHGEITDPDSIPAEMKGGRIPERHTGALRQQIQGLNYELKDIGLIDLAKDVPDDASMVIVMGPTLELLPAEWSALARYLDKGGRLLIALDPKGARGMGELEGKLGLKFNPGDLTDDQFYLQQGNGEADRRLVGTTQFSAHASTTTMSKSVGKGMLLIDSGALEDTPFTAKGPPPTKTITLRSMDSSWLDLNNNFKFDSGTEKRQRWNIGAAIEGPKVKDPEGKDRDGFRVLVFADADLFSDIGYTRDARGGLTPVAVSGPLLQDSVRWLGGEELYSGDIVSEEDKPIQHTKNQDAMWFLLTIIGAPLVVLTLGLIGTYFRRRRPTTKKTVEVKS
jgi:hypothetical protein